MTLQSYTPGALKERNRTSPECGIQQITTEPETALGVSRRVPQSASELQPQPLPCARPGIPLFSNGVICSRQNHQTSIFTVPPLLILDFCQNSGPAAIFATFLSESADAVESWPAWSPRLTPPHSASTTTGPRQLPPSLTPEPRVDRAYKQKKQLQKPNIQQNFSVIN